MPDLKWEKANTVLRAAPGTEDKVDDLPILYAMDETGQEMVISKWQLTDEEKWRLLETGELYLIFHGTTHPPVAPTVEDPTT